MVAGLRRRVRRACTLPKGLLPSPPPGLAAAAVSTKRPSLPAAFKSKPKQGVGQPNDRIDTGQR